MASKDTTQAVAVQRFWDAFKACLEENRVRPDRSNFYVKWAQTFVDFRKEWHVKQAEHSLKILYERFLPGYAPVHVPADPQSEPIMSKKQGTESTRFRDCVVPGEVDRLFSPLLQALKTEIRGRHYAIRTETAYLDWVRRFIAFHGYADPKSMEGTVEVKEYPDFLAMEREVAASTQNQALNALVFFFNNTLKEPFGEMETFVRAKMPQRLPEVMTREEVQALLAQMEGITALMAGLMYGGGLRLMECLRLRIKDIDFARHQIPVRDGKGQKDRVTTLSDRFSDPLRKHLKTVDVVDQDQIADWTSPFGLPDRGNDHIKLNDSLFAGRVKSCSVNLFKIKGLSITNHLP